MLGAQIAVKMLELYGVECVFGLPGDTSMAFYDALRASHAIRHIVCRDERAASYMADAYARLSGRPGVCEFPSGAGVLYGLPGVSEADGSCIPLVCFNSDVPTTSDGRESLTAMDVQGVVRPVVRWGDKVHRADMIPRAIRTAFRHATSGRMGAAQVGLPEDVLTSDAGPADMYVEERCASYPAYRTRPDPDLVVKAAEMIARSQRPLIVAGGGIHLSGAWSQLESLAEMARIPVATTIDGKGSIAEASPFSLGVMGGNGGKKSTNEAVGEADLVICVGTKLNSTTTAGFSLVGRDARLIQVDADPGQLGNNYRIDLGIVGDARLALADLVQALTDRIGKGRELAWDGWRSRVRELVEAEFASLGPRLSSQGSPVDPCAVVGALQRHLPPLSVVLLDAGTPTPYFTAYYRTGSPGRSVVAARTHGALGYSIPASLGAKVARPDSIVVAVFGDGSLGMAAGEIETFVRNDVPVIFLLLRNDCYGWIKSLQHIYYGRRYWGVDFAPSVDCQALFRAYGIPSYGVTSGAELDEVVGRLCAECGPAFVEVAIEPPTEFTPPVHAWVKDMLIPEEQRLRRSY